MISCSTTPIQCYTTYFGMLTKTAHIVRNITPVCITLCKPNWFEGLYLCSLRPPKSVHAAYRSKLITQDEYRHLFRQQVLMRLDPHVMLHRLQTLAGPDKVPAIVCYEKSGDFCHRHLIAEWFNTYDISCTEWQPQEHL